MLVLSRRQDEKITIGEAGDVLNGPIVVTAMDIRHEVVRIGIEAPPEIPIHRMEVYEAILAEGKISGLAESEKCSHEPMRRGQLRNVIRERETTIEALQNKVIQLTLLAEKWQRHEMVRSAIARSLMEASDQSWPGTVQEEVEKPLTCVYQSRHWKLTPRPRIWDIEEVLNEVPNIQIPGAIDCASQSSVAVD